jgi:putative two-component system response regulator
MGTVVVIADNTANLHAYEFNLKQLSDVHVLTFASPATAVKQAGDLDSDVLVVDFRMPDPRSLDFIDQFRRRARGDVPVVMVTDPDENELRMHALRIGIDDVVKKPIDALALAERVQRMLKLRGRSRKLADKAAALEEEVARSTRNIRQRELETIHRLTRAAQHRAKESRNHVVRMGHYAHLLAKAFGTDVNTQELIFRAAPMYDIGKVAVSDRILLKRGPLSPPEREIIKTHTVAGNDILRDSESALIQLAGQIALSHHEKYDGTGYPDGLAREQIPLAARICAIGDVFDALLATRPYKQPWSLPDTIQTLRRGRGSHFDPHLLDAFLDMMPKIQEIRNEFPDNEQAA